MRRIMSRNAAFALCIGALVCVLLVMPGLYDSPYARDEERCVGRITAVDNSLLHQYGLVKIGSQRLTVLLLDGPCAGREIEAGNDLNGKLETDKIFEVGDRAFIVLTTAGDEILSATAYDHHRLNIELLVAGFFALILVGYAGWAGARALLSFVFAILLMWKVLLPAILLGWDPVYASFGTITVIGGAVLFLVAGVSRMALVAWIGAFLGILLTATLALALFPPFRLHGAMQPFSETLLYSGFDGLNLGRLFIAAVFLGASGAVIDVAIDVAAAMNEVAVKRPDLSSWELTMSGFRVGRAMSCTMVTTLLMAYMSGCISLLMVLLSKGIPPLQILNINFIAAEILKTIVGSFGLVTVAPFTSVVGGFVYARRRRDVAAVVGAPALAMVGEDPVAAQSPASMPDGGLKD